MKKLLIGLAAVLILIVGALVAGPALVDWNAYKAEIEAKVEQETGRRLSLDGDITLQLIPQPVFSIGEVRFANMEGAAAPDMVALDGLEVRIALGPLMGGRVQVQSVTLLNPVIQLERAADGRASWEIELATAGVAPETAPGSTSGGNGTATAADPDQSGGAGAPASVPDVTVENFLIENGRVLFKDAGTGTEVGIEKINARFAAADLTGPYESAGSLVFRGIELGYDVNVAEIIEDRTVPLVLSLRVGPDATFRFDGGLVNLTETPKLRGQIKGEGQDLRNLIAGLGGPGDLPPVLGQAFGLEGNVEAGGDGGKAEEMMLTLGDTRVTVAAEAQTGEIITARLDVAAGKFDLDAWLAREPAATGATPAGNATGESTGAEPAGAGPASQPQQTARPPEAGPLIPEMTLPANVQATVGVTVEAVSFQGGVVQDAVLNLELANGELALNQLTAQLPGKTDVGVFGFLTTPNGQPAFDGNLELTSANLRAVLDWLQVPVPAHLPADRLRTLAVKTDLVADNRFVQLPGLIVSADGSNLTGGVTVALQRRPSFGADLRIDALNLDPYLPPPADLPSQGASAGGQVTGAPSGGQASSAAEPSAASGNTSANPLAALSILDTFDANLKLAIARLTSRGTEARDLALDVTLFQGNLDIKSAQVGNLAGAAASVAGRITDLGGLPKAEGLAARLRARDLSGLAAMTGMALPIPAQALGRTSVDLNLDGSLLAPSIAMKAETAGGAFSSKGKVSVLDLATGGVSQEITIQHPNLAQLLSRLGVAYKPSGEIGGVNARAKVTGSSTSVAVTALAGAINGTPFDGTIDADLKGAVPDVVANLNLGEFDATPFLPAEQRAGLFDIKRLPTVGVGAVRGLPADSFLVPVLLDPRWSQDPIDLSALSAVNARLNLKTPALKYGIWAFKDADLATTIRDGAAIIDRLTGSILGGTLGMTGRLTPGLDLQLSGQLEALNLGFLTEALDTERARGLLAAGFNLAARGRSQADLVSSLTGTITANGTGLDVENLSAFGFAAPLMGVVDILNQFGGVLGGQAKGGFANLKAEIDLASGIATPKLLEVASNIGVAKATGSIDLPAWRMNVTGAVEPAPNLLTAIIGGGSQPKLIPFAIEGVLDKPRVKLDTASLGQGGIRIPGVDRLLGNSGAGQLLQGILGGGSSSGQPSSQGQQAPSANEPPAQGGTPPAQQPPSQQQQPATPQDLLRGILQGLGG